MVRHITSWQINGEKEETATNFIFLGSKITADSECSHEIERHLLLGRKAMTNLDSPLKSRHHFTNKGVYSQRYGFPVVMYGCNNWTIKKAECQRTDAFELWCWRRLESPMDSKIKPVNAKGNQPWITTGRTNAEAEDLILWLPDVKSRLTGKDPDVGKDWGQEQKGETEDEMVGCHHWLNGHEFGHTLGDTVGQGSLVCCASWGHKESDMT